MLIPGKLYRFNVDCELTFFILNKDGKRYIRPPNSSERITIYKNTIHLFLGQSDVMYHLGIRKNEFIFLVYGKYLISRYSGPENIGYYTNIG